MEPIIFPTPEMVDGYVRASKIEELKKLKAEISEYAEEDFNTTSYEKGEIRQARRDIALINKRISELKGERNEI